MPLVSILIINYNTPTLVYDCLASISQFLTVPYEVIIVDNNSPDAKVDPEKVASFKSCRAIMASTNKGFGGGNNIGAAAAVGDLLWLLNSDTLLIDSSINGMIEEFAAQKEIGLATPLLFNDKELTHIQPDFYANFQNLPRLISRQARAPLSLTSTWFKTDVIVGASILLRRDLYQQLGGFDERFFMFMEDDDFCYRLKQTGLKVAVYTRARIVHLQGKSISTSKRRKDLYYTSMNYFWRKHYGIIPELLMRLIRWPYRVLKGWSR
jgi:GT2 family glycosyltransferase